MQMYRGQGKEWTGKQPAPPKALSSRPFSQLVPAEEASPLETEAAAVARSADPMTSLPDLCHYLVVSSPFLPPLSLRATSAWKAWRGASVPG